MSWSRSGRCWFQDPVDFPKLPGLPCNLGGVLFKGVARSVWRSRGHEQGTAYFSYPDIISPDLSQRSFLTFRTNFRIIRIPICNYVSKWYPFYWDYYFFIYIYYELLFGVVCVWLKLAVLLELILRREFYLSGRGRIWLWYTHRVSLKKRKLCMFSTRKIHIIQVKRFMFCFVFFTSMFRDSMFV